MCMVLDLPRLKIPRRRASTDMFVSAQRLYDLGHESKLLPLWKQADPRSLWNNYMHKVLIDNKLEPYLLPVIQGSFQNFQSAIGKDIIDVTLIARRCSGRNDISVCL